MVDKPKLPEEVRKFFAATGSQGGKQRAKNLRNSESRLLGRRRGSGGRERERIKRMAVKIRERKPGEWWVYVDHKKKRKAKKIGTKDAAKKVAEQIEARLTLGDLGDTETRAGREAGTDVCGISKVLAGASASTLQAVHHRLLPGLSGPIHPSALRQATIDRDY